MVKSVILAAGKGTRMKSDKPKVVHQVMGKPMVYYSIEAARQAGADEVCVIVGYKADEVKSAIAASVNDVKVDYALQEEQLGTGHAVKCAASPRPQQKRTTSSGSGAQRSRSAAKEDSVTGSTR